MDWLQFAVPMLVSLATAVQVAILLIVSWTDLASRLIPNSACLALGFAGALARLLAGPVELAQSAAVAAALFALLLLLHGRGLLGGGDVKLMVAMALGLSFAGTVRFFAVTALAGGVLALVHLALRRLPRPARAPTRSLVLRRVYAAERWRILRHAPLPYGVAIATGGISTVLIQTGS